MPYRHTQIGWTIFLSMGSVLLVVLWIAVLQAGPGGNLPGTPLLALFAALCILSILFGVLTVIVDDQVIQVQFGPGFPCFRFQLAEVAECEPVRNRWWWGFGIRWYLRGWLYNVSGLDAVELRMSDGRHYRIGTDQPRELAMAIQARLQSDGQR